jgi:hypothetical protein
MQRHPLGAAFLSLSRSKENLPEVSFGRVSVSASGRNQPE